MGKPKAPSPPNPKETSAASTGTNVSTAIANAYLGNVSENTPDGSTNVSQSGSQSIYDPYTKTSYSIPTFTRTTTLSPAQQAIKDQQDQASLGLSTLGNNQTKFLQDYLSKPFDGSNEATEARLLELGRKRLDPILADQDQQLQSTLAGKGIKEGSDAYYKSIGQQSRDRNDAYNQLILGGHQQAFSEAQAERNQPINEITALLSGGQVSQPNFMGANMPTIPTTDVAGLINENFNQKMNVYNTKAAQSQNILGGLFGLGAAGIYASDKRVKKDIEPVGELKGHKIYEYRYKDEPGNAPKSIGVMAQEVQRKRPDAIVKDGSGVLKVNYGALFGMGEAA